MHQENAAALVDRGLLRPNRTLQTLPRLNLYVNDMRGEGYLPILNELPNLSARVGTFGIELNEDNTKP
jgi:hypothetical protein